jgi:copper chaperone CopZ
MMSNVDGELVAIFRIAGMHCHRCEKLIQDELCRLPGVDEVEVDFPSAQASVVYEPAKVTTAQLRAAVVKAGYVVLGVALVSHEGVLSE